MLFSFDHFVVLVVLMLLVIIMILPINSVFLTEIKRIVSQERKGNFGSTSVLELILSGISFLSLFFFSTFFFGVCVLV